MRQERSNRWERMRTLGEFSPRRAAWEMSPPSPYTALGLDQKLLPDLGQGLCALHW